MSESYKLAASLYGHEQDVRAVTSLSNDIIVSAARDQTVRTWQRTGANEFTAHNIFGGHSHFVNTLATLPPSQQFPNGLIVSGGSDKLILVYDPMQPHEPLYTLIGHTANVCALAVTPTGHIVSGSWDKTVIVWKDFQLAYTLKGHEAAVWAVLPLNDDTILTAAADKTIRLWNQDKQIKVLQGHTDAVRGLARVPNFGFVSCANDGTLRVWTESGECMQELNGHTSFVYSVAVLGSGEFVSSGEDRTVRIWKDGQCVQTLQQPCISVWTVATLPNDDIIVGGSDNVVRIFTRSSERMASQEAQNEFDTLLANQAIPSNQIGDINKEKLPGMEALNTPGQKEGQVIMVNVPGGAVEAHQWSGQTQTWQKIGEVVGGVGSGKKQIYDGQEYDYVFDIDIGNGPSGMLKLPYNVTQNPYDAAQKFLWKHELPQMYLDEVANFIIKNAEGVELGTSSTNYADPFTGGNRYTPTQRPPSSTSGAGFSDPFTGGSSYRNPSAQSVPATKGPVPRSAILPLNSYLALKQTNLDAIHTKLQTLNQNNQSVALSDAELTALGKAIQFLKAGSVGMMDSDGMQVIVKLCDQWSVNQRFPGLDLLRLCTLYAPESVASAVPTGDVPGFICSAGGLANGVVGDKIAETNAMLAYRALANLFNQAEGRHMAWNSKNTIAEVLQIDIVMNFKGKMARLAISTLAINFAVLLTSKADRDDDTEIGLVGTLAELIKSEQDDENLYRMLTSLGTLLYRSDACKEVGRIMEVKTELHRIRDQKGGQERMQKVIGEILSLL